MPTIQELAVQLAAADRVIEALQYQNTSKDPKERLAADARYRLAMAGRDEASRLYHDALSRMSSEELVALAAAKPAASS